MQVHKHFAYLAESKQEQAFRFFDAVHATRDFAPLLKGL
jgi:hypothetical protein